MDKKHPSGSAHGTTSNVKIAGAGAAPKHFPPEKLHTTRLDADFAKRMGMPRVVTYNASAADKRNGIIKRK